MSSWIYPSDGGDGFADADDKDGDDDDDDDDDDGDNDDCVFSWFSLLLSQSSLHIVQATAFRYRQIQTQEHPISLHSVQIISHPGSSLNNSHAVSAS